MFTHCSITFYNTKIEYFAPLKMRRSDFLGLVPGGVETRMAECSKIVEVEVEDSASAALCSVRPAVLGHVAVADERTVVRSFGIANRFVAVGKSFEWVEVLALCIMGSAAVVVECLVTEVGVGARTVVFCGSTRIRLRFEVRFDRAECYTNQIRGRRPIPMNIRERSLVVVLQTF